jgi:hypothetical protein
LFPSLIWRSDEACCSAAIDTRLRDRLTGAVCF